MCSQLMLQDCCDFQRAEAILKAHIQDLRQDADAVASRRNDRVFRTAARAATRDERAAAATRRIPEGSRNP